MYNLNFTQNFNSTNNQIMADLNKQNQNSRIVVINLNLTIVNFVFE